MSRQGSEWASKQVIKCMHPQITIQNAEVKFAINTTIKKGNLGYKKNFNTKADGRDNTRKAKLKLHFHCGSSKEKKKQKETETKSLSIWLLSL